MIVLDLENKNAILKREIDKLEKDVRDGKNENEKSSQKFTAYAEQCNTQLNNLNKQVI